MAIRNVAIKQSEFAVTDIMNEPITEGGLRSRFEIVSIDVRGRAEVFEAVGTREQIERLALAAVSVVAGAPVAPGNVVDLRTGQPIGDCAKKLSFEIVRDAAPGRNDTGYMILEASGSREQIAQLASEAKQILL